MTINQDLKQTNSGYTILKILHFDQKIKNHERTTCHYLPRNNGGNTRVPIKNLFDYLKGGDSLKDFLNDFPAVSREHSLKVLSFAEGILTMNNSPEHETAA